MRILRRQRLVPQAVNHRPLLVQHVVKLQRPLPVRVVPLLHSLLRTLHRLVQPRMLQLLPVLQSHPLHQLRHPLRSAEIHHQRILETDVENTLARVPLTRTTTPQLPVNPPRFMPLGRNHKQPAQFRHACAQLDVRPPASHVRRHGHRSALTGPSHNLRLVPVILRIQHLVRNLLQLHHPRQRLRSLHTSRPHQDRLSVLMPLLDQRDHRIVLLPPRLVDLVVVVLPGHRTIRRNDQQIEFVNVVKLARLGLRRPRHPA